MKYQRYAVCGNPVGHSLSPWLHGYFGRLTQRPVYYAAYPVAQEGFGDFVTHFFAQGGNGINVTLPFKADALELSDVQTGFSQQVGAANVLAMRHNKIHAFNTDGAGFSQDIQCLLGSVNTKRVLLLGAGGAARAVAFAIANEQPKAFYIYNRTAKKAQALAEECGAVAVDALEGDSYELIVNATSMGHSPAAAMALPPSLFELTELAYDLSYGDAAADFLAVATAHGAKRVRNGIGMLVRQAALSFAIWEGVLPSTAYAIDYLHRTGA